MDSEQLEIESYKLIIETFKSYAHYFATNDAPLPRSGEIWSGRKHTSSEAEDLKRITPDLTEDEISRRRRAFGPSRL